MAENDGNQNSHYIAWHTLHEADTPNAESGTETGAKYPSGTEFSLKEDERNEGRRDFAGFP